MKVAGIWVTLTDSESLPTSEARHMKASGPTTNIMARAFHFTSIIFGTKVNSERASKKVLVPRSGPMEVRFMEITSITKEMAMVFKNGLIINLTPAITKTISSKDSERINGQMAASSLEIG